MFREPRRSQQSQAEKESEIEDDVSLPIELSVVDEESQFDEPEACEDEQEIPTDEQDDKLNAEFSSEQQQAYLDLLLRGASPAAACVQLKMDLFAIVECLANDDEFRMKTDAVYDALSQNVAARLYQEAMKGSVPAMNAWLKNRPPPEWPDHVAEINPTSVMDVMSDEELIRLARLENLTIPAELETNATKTSGEKTPEIVP